MSCGGVHLQRATAIIWPVRPARRVTQLIAPVTRRDRASRLCRPLPVSSATWAKLRRRIAGRRIDRTRSTSNPVASRCRRNVVSVKCHRWRGNSSANQHEPNHFASRLSSRGQTTMSRPPGRSSRASPSGSARAPGLPHRHGVERFGRKVQARQCSVMQREAGLAAETHGLGTDVNALGLPAGGCHLRDVPPDAATEVRQPPLPRKRKISNRTPTREHGPRHRQHDGANETRPAAAERVVQAIDERPSQKAARHASLAGGGLVRRILLRICLRQRRHCWARIRPAEAALSAPEHVELARQTVGAVATGDEHVGHRGCRSSRRGRLPVASRRQACITRRATPAAGCSRRSTL